LFQSIPEDAFHCKSNKSRTWRTTRWSSYVLS